MVTTQILTYVSNKLLEFQELYKQVEDDDYINNLIGSNNHLTKEELYNYTCHRLESLISEFNKLEDFFKKIQ